MTTFEDLLEQKQITRNDLYTIADRFGIDIPNKVSTSAKKTIELLKENGVSYDDAVKFGMITKEAQMVADNRVEPPAQPKKPGTFLVKMNRENSTYEVRGYKFTKQDPFCLVTEEDLEYLVKNEEGFSLATPGEAAAYYGNV